MRMDVPSLRMWIRELTLLWASRKIMALGTFYEYHKDGHVSLTWKETVNDTGKWKWFLCVCTIKNTIRNYMVSCLIEVTWYFSRYLCTWCIYCVYNVHLFKVVNWLTDLQHTWCRVVFHFKNTGWFLVIWSTICEICAQLIFALEPLKQVFPTLRLHRIPFTLLL